MARMPVDDRRQKLVSAAFRVVADRGLSAASTRAIVAEAGMSLASFHYAFASRDDLLDRLITEVVDTEEKAVVPTGDEDSSLLDLLTTGLSGYLDHLRADPAREQAMLELTQYAVRSRKGLARVQYRQYTRIARAGLQLAADRTGYRWSVPLGTVSALLVSLTDGMTMSWLVHRDDALADALIDAAARAVASLAEPVTT